MHSKIRVRVHGISSNEFRVHGMHSKRIYGMFLLFLAQHIAVGKEKKKQKKEKKKKVAKKKKKKKL